MSGETAGAVAPVLARLYGTPVTELPQDLFIPPEALEVLLDTFEGPLDLLLYLIRKHSLDVLDIPMAELTRQYMDYVEVMHARQLELAAEYLVMAAWLIEIKSRMLLPRKTETLDEEADPRAELARKLLEYEQMKLAAQRLDTLPQAGRNFSLVSVWVEQGAVARLPQVAADDLLAAWRDILQRARVTRHHRISREELSVREHMTRILKRLGDEAYVEFRALFDVSGGVPMLVVSFLALLELVREALVEVTQEVAFAPIYVRRAGIAPVPALE